MNGKRILSMDAARRGETRWLACCWDDCENYGVDLHKTLFHDHNSGVPCSSLDAKHIWYVFCSERHRQMFLNAHIDGQGKLPMGERGRLL